MGWQDIEPSAFDRNDKRTLADLYDTLQEVKHIYINARTCSELSRDENAWCIDVLQPLVRLVLKLHGNGKWWFQSVYVALLSYSRYPPLTQCGTQAIPDHQSAIPIPRPFAFALQLRQTHPH